MPEETPGTLSERVSSFLDLGDAASWLELTAGESRFRLYGFIRFDMAWDDSTFNDNQLPFFVRGEDPNDPAAVPKDDGEFTIHVRSTRIGLDFTGPPIDSLGNPDLTGKIEIHHFPLGQRARFNFMGLFADREHFAGTLSDRIAKYADGQPKKYLTDRRLPPP